MRRIQDKRERLQKQKEWTAQIKDDRVVSLEYKTCACGCGKPVPQAWIKYVDTEHKMNHQYKLKAEERRRNNVESEPEPEQSEESFSDFLQKLSLQERMDAVPKYLREICKEYFDWELQDFHEEILKAMFAGGYLVVNVPTDHAKSTMGCFLFPLLSLMNNPNETHIICGANINDSKRRVQALELEIETNKPLVRDFPWLAKAEEKEGRIWSATQFNVSGRTINKPNPSVLAAAVGSNDIKGRRGKLMMDDIEGEDARWSPMKREQLYSWLKLEAWRCYEDRKESPRPLLCLLGTPMDVDSIYFKMEGQGWKVIRYPVYRSQERINARGQLVKNWPTYLWSDKQEKVDRARKTLRKLEFSVAYLMDPTGGDPTRMSAAEIQEYVKESIFNSRDYLGLVSIDPASGSSNKRADYTGIAVLKIHWPQGDELPEVELQEAHAYTQGLFEQVHFCANLAHKYGYQVIYEINSQQGGAYGSSFQHLHPEVKLLHHYTSHANKFDSGMGLSIVKTLVNKKKLRVAEELIESDGIQHFVTEVRDLQPPFKSHDHICAAIWFAVRYAYEQVRHYKGPKLNNTYLKPYGGRFIPGGASALGFGFGSQPSEYERLLNSEREKEQRRFLNQLNGRNQ